MRDRRSERARAWGGTSQLEISGSLSPRVSPVAAASSSLMIFLPFPTPSASLFSGQFLHPILSPFPVPCPALPYPTPTASSFSGPPIPRTLSTISHVAGAQCHMYDAAPVCCIPCVIVQWSVCPHPHTHKQTGTFLHCSRLVQSTTPIVSSFSHTPM